MSRKELTYEEEFIRRESIIGRIEYTIMANKSFKLKSEFRVPLNPTESHTN